jgi:transcriptional regulator with XRE-family HTH domain
MIDPDQIRAARALLDWNLDRLRQVSGVPRNQINRIERGKVTPRQETLDKIEHAFEEAGLEFLPGSGVRKKDRIIQIYEGKGAARRLVDDIQKTLSIADSGPGGKREILIAHLKEDVARQHLGPDFIEEQIRKRKAAGITHRLLVRTKDPGLFPPYNTYHIMPDHYFSQYPLYIYGSKLALLAWDPEKSVMMGY